MANPNQEKCTEEWGSRYTEADGFVIIKGRVSTQYFMKSRCLQLRMNGLKKNTQHNRSKSKDRGTRQEDKIMEKHIMTENLIV